MRCPSIRYVNPNRLLDNWSLARDVLLFVKRNAWKQRASKPTTGRDLLQTLQSSAGLQASFSPEWLWKQQRLRKIVDLHGEFKLED